MMHDRERRRVSASTISGKRASHVIAGAAAKPHAVAILACDNPEAIVLDFMQPQVAGGQLVGLCGKARRDEAGREGTLQHVG
jgi:CheY-like chemotaxis protein